jgi:hypothetical protein
MPPNAISDEDVRMADTTSPESRTNSTARILGKRPREGGEPTSDEDQVRFLSIDYVS